MHYFKNLLPVLTAAIILSLSNVSAKAETLSASDITGLRSFDSGSNVLLLTFQAVKTGTEDRTIAHFDISGFLSAPLAASLIVPIVNLDALEDYDGTFDIYSFAGDGTVSTDEWDSGTFLHGFSGLEQPGSLTVDITSLLAASIASNDSYLSFNYRGGSGTDRYFLGDTVGLDDNFIDYQVSAVPLPPAAYLFGTALLGLAGIRRRKQKAT